MSIKNTTSYKVVESILHQQFFTKPNNILSRGGSKKVKIVGVSKIINKLVLLMTDIFENGDLGKPDGIITKFSELLKIDKKILLKSYRSKMKSCEGIEDLDTTLHLTFILASIITPLQEQEIIESHKKLAKVFQENLDLSTEELEEYFNYLSQNSNESFSLYHNLFILKRYSHISGESYDEEVFQKRKEKFEKELIKEYKQWKKKRAI